ncbi:MAG: hypothetical protein LQ348_004272 [Seirophora lacunosa]|nr:MAG: hypothetical protein LQ348_004272 [Seirophora lacunosa]
MSSSAALSESMQRITTSKLTVLKKQRDAFESTKQATLDAVQHESALPEQLLTLLDALIIHDVPAVVPNFSPDNVRRFLNQRRNDPSVSSAMLEGWKRDLEKCLDIQSHKYEYASLFGQLVTEWLEKPSNAPVLQPESSSDFADTASQDSFEPLGRREMYDQWREWETLVFNPAQKSDPQTIKAYLSNLFESTETSKKLTKSPLETLRTQLKEFDLDPFEKDTLKRTIAGILNSELLAPSKKAALMDVNGNDLVLGEMVDVLNIQIADLDQWSWGENPVSVDLRRQLNGKYRVYMDEELLQALLIHFIGIQWAVYLKDAFTTFFHSGAWKLSSHRALNRKARARRNEFLGEDAPSSDTVRNDRRRDYEVDFFMTQLPSSVAEGSRGYNGGLAHVESDSSVQGAGLASKKDPMEIKQTLLHLVTTESLINTSLYGTFTVLQSDFRWFGPSLSHTTIFTVLEYLGVKERWLKFFRKFLETPLRSVQDGPDAPTNTRRCGIPVDHALSDAFGESVLFCLDFAVNQATHTNLYRLHDDLWFWGQEDVCVKAWATIGEFAKTMGLSVNEEKTGSVQITDQPNEPSRLHKSLPRGKVHWGFLQLDTTGSWIINDTEATHHISELRRQLKACNSVLATVQAWNVYVSRFLANNFGQPQRCLGQRHIDMVIATFSDIQRRLFSDAFAAASLLEYLKRIIEERFHVTGLPDGFFYFPLELGGLDVRNPLIPLLLAREVEDTAAQQERKIGEVEKQKDPKEWIQEAFERDEEEYEVYKKRYDEGQVGEHSNSKNPNNHNNDSDEEDRPFMSFEEFTAYREDTSLPLLHAYLRLREGPPETHVTLTADVQAALRRLPDLQGKEGIHRNIGLMDGYWKWVAQLYAGDVLARFGGLGMGEKKLLPLGLVTMLRGEKVRWEG